MARAIPIVCRVVSIFVFSLFSLSLTAPLATAGTHEDRLAARELERRQTAASGHRSDSVVVDGTPRPTAPSSPKEFDVDAIRGDSGRSEGTQKSLTTQIGEAGMAVPLGGDDVIIASGTQYDSTPLMRITADGTYFVAVAALTQIEVWKSTDSGESWTLWSTFADPLSGILWIADMELAEGDVNRLFLAWPGYSTDSVVRVAYADPEAAIPTWTIVTALQEAGIDHGQDNRIEIATDVAFYPDYYVYVIAVGEDGDGQDIWFTRSLNMGDSYVAGYKIADSATSPYVEFKHPSISYGHEEWVHASYLAAVSSDSGGDLLYRRIPLSAEGGSGAWEAEQTIKPMSGSAYSLPFSMTASATDGLILVSALQFGGSSRNQVFFSTDHGATWPAANEAVTGLFIGAPKPLILPSGEIVQGSRDNNDLFPNISMMLARSTTADPLTWTTPQAFTHSPFTLGELPLFETIAADPTRDHRVAAVWAIGVDGFGTLRFDAEWRRDPGYGNTEVGFPFDFGGGGQTPPAIAEIDGDPFGEIIFGTRSGDIHVLNHDGSPVPGWPVNIGSMPLDAPVAVANLGVAGYNHVVAGNTVGEVYAFNADGSLMSGFPVQMNEVADVFVSIGALGPPDPMYIVAACGLELRAIRPSGETVGNPEWAWFTSPLTRPAAIGDVDNDGVVEVVTLKDEYLHINAMGVQVPEVFRVFPGVSFSDAPTLADFDRDGDLEIAAPTTSGVMYLMNHDGTDVPGWPFTVASGQALTSPAIADFLGIGDLEMTFVERDGSGLLHIVSFGGLEQDYTPLPLDLSLMFMPPILVKGNLAPGHIVTASTDGIGHNRSNLGFIPNGWPRNLPDFVEETPASGDIDNDGRTEIVFLGFDLITVLDIGVSGWDDPRTRWPMYGFDAQRTGCFECFGPGVSATEDTPGPLASSLTLDVYPNPFNPSTTIAYEVTKAGPVVLKLFDIRGRMVDEIVRGEIQSAGQHSIQYEPRLASGMYFLMLESGGETATQKIGLLK